MARVALISLYDEFCLGLRHVGGYLREHGHEVTLIHFKRYARQTLDGAGRLDAGPTHEQYLTAITPWGDELLNFAVPYSEGELKLLLSLLAERRVALAGLSVPSYHKKTALELSRAIKTSLGLPVAWGGVHPTIAPEDCFDREGVVDFVCRCEGELTFREFLEGFDRRADFSATPVAGMWIRAGGRIIRNAHRPVEPNLDRLGMPLFDERAEFLIDGDRILHQELAGDRELSRNYKLISGRGCPFSCSYCIYSTIKRQFPDLKRVRRRSPPHVIAELRRAKDRLPCLERIEFYDDIFTSRHDWLAEFAALYKREIAIPFWCYTHPLCVRRETLELLKDMGIEFIIMGIQSGSDRINFEVYDRKTSRAKILEAARLIAACRIPVVYDLLCANPYETEEDLSATLDLLTQIPSEYYLQLGELAFFPATTITERREREQPAGAVDGKARRFWNALYLLAQYKVGRGETLMALAKDPFLRENPQILWDTVKLAARAREDHGRREKAEALLNPVLERLRAVEIEHAGFKSRKVVQLAVRLGDAARKIAARLHRPRPEERDRS